MTRYQVSSLIPTIKAESISTHNNEIIVFKTLKGNDLRYGKEEAISVDGYVTGYLLEGQCTLMINNVTHKLNKGDRVILTPNHIHRLTEHSKNCQFLIMIIDSICTRLTFYDSHLSNVNQWAYSFFNPVISLKEDEFTRLSNCMRQIQFQVGRKDCYNHVAFILNAIELHHIESEEIIMSRYESRNEGKTRTPRRQQIMNEIIVLVANNFKKQHRVSFYADKLCLTGQYINQICTEHMGMTLSDMIGKVTYATARNILLSSEKTIQQISAELSFPDQATFCKFFKKMSGMTPTEMRKDSIRKGTFSSYHQITPNEA